MTRGFYEQLSVPADADLEEIRAAYGRAVSHLMKRREATVAQGGDPSSLDLARTRLDEAWEALSDPARRRRYDAMLAVAGDGVAPTDLADLWSRVAGAMIHPAVSAAARIVDAATSLHLGPLPETPTPVAGGGVDATFDDDLLPASSPGSLPDVASFGRPRPAASAPPRRVSSGGTFPGEVVPLRVEATPPLRVVRTRESSADVIELPPPTSPTVIPPTMSAGGDVDALVDQLGYSGALLRTLRERQGLALQAMSEITRISPRYLEAVEREDFAALPPGQAFVRGYVREVARLLGLDVERTVAGYMRRFSHDA